VDLVTGVQTCALPILRFCELAANRTFDPEGNRGEAQGRVSENPRDPPDEAHPPAAEFASEAAENQNQVPIQERRGDLLLLVRLQIGRASCRERGAVLW